MPPGVGVAYPERLGSPRRRVQDEAQYLGRGPHSQGVGWGGVVTPPLEPPWPFKGVQAPPS